MLRRALIFPLLAVTGQQSSLYPTWAHYHQVWECGSDNCGTNQTTALAWLDAWAAHNITVGSLNIDSGWATGFNTFSPRTAAFPDFEALVNTVHGRSIRVTLWMTSMVDVDSPNYADALARGYFIRDASGAQAGNISWWHGRGGLLDYTQPAARAWWEAQMDNVLKLSGGSGVDGWKCDGTDPYVIELLFPRGLNQSITYEQYADLYYGHTFNYTRSINDEGAIWSRPVDTLAILSSLNLSLFLAYSPRYVLFSGWVGDQDPSFVGLRAAAINILESAWQNYTNFGSDTAGYRGGQRTRELFLRWSQLNAFLPFFENGGNDVDQHTPWYWDNDNTTQVTDAYRRLVAAHYELVPYLLTTGVAAYEAGVSAIWPTSAPPVDFPFMIEPDQVTDWSYALGPTMFASPVVEAGVAAQPVTLPDTAATAALQARWPGAGGEVSVGASSSSSGSGGAAAPGWSAYWNPVQTWPAGAKLNYPVPLVDGGPDGRIANAVFVREGSLLPLHVSTPLGALPQGRAAWAPALTLLAHVPAHGEAWSAALDVRDAAGNRTAVRAARGSGMNSQIDVAVASFQRPLIFVLRRRAAADGSPPPPVLGVSVRAGSGATLSLLERVAEPASADTPLALSWDATDEATGGGRYPLAGGLLAAVAADFERELAGRYSHSPAAASPSHIDEVVIYVSATDAVAGAVVTVHT